MISYSVIYKIASYTLLWNRILINPHHTFLHFATYFEIYVYFFLAQHQFSSLQVAYHRQTSDRQTHLIHYGLPHENHAAFYCVPIIFLHFYFRSLEFTSPFLSTYIIPRLKKSKPDYDLKSLCPSPKSFSRFITHRTQLVQWHLPWG